MKKRRLNIASQSEKPSSVSCEHCGSPLAAISLKVFGEEIILRPACECRLREMEERERQARLNELHHLLRQNGLENGLYARMCLEDWEKRDPSCERAVGKLKGYLDSAHLGGWNWLYLYGVRRPA